jgi:hypothetical protein
MSSGVIIPAKIRKIGVPVKIIFGTAVPVVLLSPIIPPSHPWQPLLHPLPHAVQPCDETKNP